MRYFLLIGLLSIAACDKEVHHRGFGKLLAEDWAKSLGEGDSKATCQEYYHLVGVSDVAYCAVRIGEHIYSVSCLEDTNACYLDTHDH